MASKAHKNLTVLGWREWVALPDLKVKKIKAKIDTGARTSSLHAFDLKKFRRGRQTWVSFIIHPLQRNTRKEITVKAKVIEERRVKSSNGEWTLRPVVRTDVEVEGRRWPIELTLINRDEMGFRMLLGREAIRGKFAVDPGRSFVTGKEKTYVYKAKKEKM